MAVRGRAAVSRYLADLPGQIEAKLLRGAARAGMAVVKAEAAERVTSDLVREKLTVKPPRTMGNRVTVRLTVNGRWANSVATWLEHGTHPHVITVDETQRQGRSIGRINQQLRDAGGDTSLVIGGRFVGRTVHHPGARPHPFLRVSLDLKEREAIAAAQSFINARVKGGRITGSAEDENA